MYVGIVDDDPSVARALSRLLDVNGIESRTYGSARAFLESLDSERPGCLVLDALMPGMTGLELQEELARVDAVIPTIMLTADFDDATRAEALRGGAVTFLRKPCDPHILVAAIKAALARE